MEVYLVDTAYVKTDVMDDFSSFIWTERYGAHGDFEMVVVPNIKMRAILKTGIYVAHSETRVLMLIEEVFLQESEEGEQTLSVKGRTLTALFESRIVMRNRSTGLNWIGKATVGSLTTSLVSSICVTGVLTSTYDVIPQMYVKNDSTDATIVDVALEPQPLYKAVEDMCGAERLGFSVSLDAPSASPRLKFRVYQGVLRPNVVFSSMLDNLAQESYLASQTNYKNICYVWSKDGLNLEIVAATGTSLTISGTARKVMTITASDIDPTTVTAAELKSQMQRRGREALAENKYVKVFDGQLTSNNPFKFKTDYALGDTVAIMDENKTKKQVYVSEYIWGIDGEGLREYPTFAEIS